MAIIMTLWMGNGAVAIKRILKINDSCPVLFNFQNSFNCQKNVPSLSNWSD